MNNQAAVLLASTVQMITSRHTGREYRITISLPLGYAKEPGEGWPFHETPEQWPVVYVLDGDWYAALVTETIRPMAWCGSTTDAIVVGIGYPVENPTQPLSGRESPDPIAAFRTSFTRRNADLTPVRDEAEEKRMERNHKRSTPSGDAANFLKFIQDELVPLIEQSYRADPAKRILLGHSYGGLFALFAMFEAPDLFSTLIAGSPTLAYGNRFTFGREEAYAQAHRALPAKLYLFVGEDEEESDDTTLTDTLRMVAILQGRHYEGFTLVKQIFLGQNHCEVAAPGFQAGLKFALRR
jgi:predicted alpha/beta superfamily hydrolase